MRRRNFKPKKAQGSLEYLILIAAALAITSMVVLFSTGFFSSQKGSISFGGCRQAAGTCGASLFDSPNDPCPQCETACVEKTGQNTGKDIMSQTEGCGGACTLCKQGQAARITATETSQPHELTPDSSTVGLWHFNEGVGGSQLVLSEWKTNTQVAFNEGIYFQTVYNVSASAVQMNASPSDSSTVGLWHFDEGSGSTASDSSGKGNSGTITGAVWNTTGKFGQALTFDGVDDYVNIPANVVNSSNPFTVEAWVKANSLAMLEWQKLIVSDRAAGDNWDVYQANSNSFGFSVWTTAGSYSVSTPSITANTWYHVAAVYNGSSLVIYLNGIGSTPVSTSGTLYDHAGPTRVGISNLALTKRFFNGTIDEVAIWNRVLSADEIANQYSRIVGGYTSKIFDSNSTVAWNTLEFTGDVPYQKELPDNGAVETARNGSNMNGNVGLWHFNEGSGTTAADGSGKANTGTVIDAVWNSSGKFGNALAFDGNGDYVLKSSFSSFPSAEITAEFWINTNDSGDGIISYASAAGDNDFLIYNSGNLQINRGAAATTTGISINDGEWHNVAVTWKGSSGDLKVYLDGTLRYSATLSAGTSITPDGCLVIGQEQDSICGGFSVAQAFGGTIDEVAIWGRTLSASEIFRNYLRGAVSFNVSYRSCSSPTCSGEQWVNAASAGPPINIGQGVSSNRYFQFGFNFSTADFLRSPMLYNVSVNYSTGGGAAVIDSSGRGNNGVTGGTVSAASGKFGSALGFDGASGYAEKTSFSGLPASQITVEAWIKINGYPQYWNRIVNHEWVNDGWLLMVNSAGTVCFGMGQSSVQYLATKTAASAGVWYHVAGTYDGSNVRVYVNGVEGTPAALNGAVIDNAGNVDVGGKSVDRFSGTIDEVAIYNRAKTDSEIWVDANA